jgi:hypothetical protein
MSVKRARKRPGGRRVSLSIPESYKRDLVNSLRVKPSA